MVLVDDKRIRTDFTNFEWYWMWVKGNLQKSQDHGLTPSTAYDDL